MIDKANPADTIVCSYVYFGKATDKFSCIDGQSIAYDNPPKDA